MGDKKQAQDRFTVLRERAKELNCLYQVEELLGNDRLSLPQIFKELIVIIPFG